MPCALSFLKQLATPLFYSTHSSPLRIKVAKIKLLYQPVINYFRKNKKNANGFTAPGTGSLGQPGFA